MGWWEDGDDYEMAVIRQMEQMESNWRIAEERATSEDE